MVVVKVTAVNSQAVLTVFPIDLKGYCATIIWTILLLAKHYFVDYVDDFVLQYCRF